MVSATGTYLDLADDVVVHVPGRAGRTPREIAAALAGLLEDEDRRGRIGDAARAHVDRARAPPRPPPTATREAIDGTLALLADPTRRVLARWGGALVDLGVTEEHLAEGYGLSYARALDDFVTPTSAG